MCLRSYVAYVSACVLVNYMTEHTHINQTKHQQNTRPPPRPHPARKADPPPSSRPRHSRPVFPRPFHTARRRSGRASSSGVSDIREPIESAVKKVAKADDPLSVWERYKGAIPMHNKSVISPSFLRLVRFLSLSLSPSLSCLNSGLYFFFFLCWCLFFSCVCFGS